MRDGKTSSGVLRRRDPARGSESAFPQSFYSTQFCLPTEQNF